MPKVRDILKPRELFSVEAAQSVADVTRRMAELRVGAIMVLENGELRGIFSERDLMTRCVVAQRDPSTTSVTDVMTTDVATIDESATPEHAMESMRHNNCRHLPVFRDRQLVGFLSMRDLMNFELARKTDELHRMQAYIHGTA